MGLQWEGEQEHAGCIRGLMERPSSCAAAASAGALLLESVACKPWLWRSVDSKSWAEWERQALLSRVNTLTACTRLQFNSRAADMFSFLCTLNRQSKNGSVSDRRGAGAAVGPQGTGNTPSQPLNLPHRDPSHQVQPRQAQATSQNVSSAPMTSQQSHPATSTGHQADGTPGASDVSGSTGGCDERSDDEMIHMSALTRDMGSLLGAACRLLRATQLLLSTASG
ncbi:hypothetical protein DUNSADRAFT_14202 [Dunaliella salina]|uniref:Encoded protein n=1 Tax=Dunaliella salina TaxID=3046 RepID=A0ABQ7G7U4_DUNSA|nr:hypothetical protein DUNSADRAFT_14202 [Dunaliella salina]|eukprot:KAF5830664.1 hypothetical protein DUNSADRAFT_14202 [Dunaliella salina]